VTSTIYSTTNHGRTASCSKVHPGASFEPTFVTIPLILVKFFHNRMPKFRHLPPIAPGQEPDLVEDSEKCLYEFTLEGLS
jgi:hypothetical protein